MAAAVTLPGDDLRIVDDLVSGAADAAAAGESGAQADQVGRTEGYVELGRRGRRSTTNANWLRRPDEGEQNKAQSVRSPKQPGNGNCVCVSTEREIEIEK